MRGASTSRSPGDPSRHKRGGGVLGRPEIGRRLERGTEARSASPSVTVRGRRAARSDASTRPSAAWIAGPDLLGREIQGDPQRSGLGDRAREACAPPAATGPPAASRPAPPSPPGPEGDGPRSRGLAGWGPPPGRSSSSSSRRAGGASRRGALRNRQGALGETGQEPAALVGEHVIGPVRRAAEVPVERARPLRRPAARKRRGRARPERPRARSAGPVRTRQWTWPSRACNTATSASSLLRRQARGHAHAADRERRLARRHAGPPEPLDPERVDVGRISVTLRRARDRVVGSHAREVGHRRRHVTPPHAGAVLELGDVRRSGRQAPEQLRLEPGVAAEDPRELQHARRVPEHLDRLDSRDLVEEPAARRVHEQAMALELEAPERLDAVRRAQRADRVALEEGLHGRGAPIEDHLHVRVARGPRVLDQRARSRLVERVRRRRAASRATHGGAPASAASSRGGAPPCTRSRRAIARRRARSSTRTRRPPALPSWADGPRGRPRGWSGSRRRSPRSGRRPPPAPSPRSGGGGHSSRRRSRPGRAERARARRSRPEAASPSHHPSAGARRRRPRGRSPRRRRRARAPGPPALPPVRPARIQRLRPRAASRLPGSRTLAAWPGARSVNRTPSSASTSRVSRSAAVSGSHIPAASRPKRCRKSARPHRTWVTLSRRLQSGRIAWP